MNDIALLLVRLALGGFYLLARYRWVYDPYHPSSTKSAAHTDEPLITDRCGDKWFNRYRERHLRWKLERCGYHGGLAGPVATAELICGLALILGFGTKVSALVLLIITLCATLATARDKVLRQNPVDTLDKITCYMWLVEPHLIVLALVLVLCGAGTISVDQLM